MTQAMTPSEVLHHLIRFVEDPEDVATMTPEEVRAELSAEGVDVEGLKTRLDEILKRPHEARLTPPPTEEPGNEE